MTDSVKKLLSDSGFPGIKLLQFAFDSRDGGGDMYLPENYPENIKYGLEYALTVVKPDGEQINYSKEMMERYFQENENAKFELLFDSEEDAMRCV